MLNVHVQKDKVEANSDVKIIRGTVGMLCKITFDDFWEKYQKTVVFKYSSNNLSRPYMVHIKALEEEIEIPWEVLVECGAFKIGAYGITETETLPTLWSEEILIEHGTDTHGTAPEDYTPSEIDQLRVSKQDKLTAGDGILIKGNVISAGGSGGGTTNYEKLSNKPSINGVELVGNKTTSDLGIEIPDLVGEKSEEIETLQGRIDATTGVPSYNVNSLYTDFMTVETFKRFTITSGLRVRTYQYTADKSYIGTAEYGENNMKYIDTKGDDIYKENYTFNEATAYIRLAIAYNPSTTITPQDVSVILTSEVRALKELQSGIDKNKAEIEQLKTAPCTREFSKEYINNVLCIGDSLTQGCYYNGGLQGHSSGKAIAENYPYFLSKMSNWSVKNAGVSGYSPVHWWNAYEGQDELTEEVLINKFKGLNFADYDFFIIWLGTNGNTVDGVTHGLTDTLDTDVTPYSDYNDFADNGTGCYCKIISAIIEANPYARIVLGNVYTTVDVETTNTVINKIADIYSDNVLGVISMAEFKQSADTLKYHPFYLDTDGNVVVGTNTGDDVRGNPTHLGKVGNLHLAKHFLDEITKLISENELKFEYILPEELLNPTLNDIESELGGI